jgi:uncharacterized membrane protein YgcG
MKGTASNRASRHNDRVARVGYTRLYATLSGALLVLLGLAGLIENSEFAEPELWSELFGFYAANGWAGAAHVALGLMALLLAQGLSRLWAVIAAILFLGLGVWGVLATNATLLFGVLPATRPVNILNLLLGLLAALALIASRWDRITYSASRCEEKLQERRVARKQKRERRLRRKRLSADADEKRPNGQRGTDAKGRRGGGRSRPGGGGSESGS